METIAERARSHLNNVSLVDGREVNEALDDEEAIRGGKFSGDIMEYGRLIVNDNESVQEYKFILRRNRHNLRQLKQLIEIKTGIPTYMQDLYSQGKRWSTMEPTKPISTLWDDDAGYPPLMLFLIMFDRRREHE